MYPCSLVTWLLQVSPFCDGIGIMDNSLVYEIKLISWVVVCVTKFWCNLVIEQLDNVFDLQPAPKIYAVRYLCIKIRHVIFPTVIQCTITSFSHPVTDDKTIKLDQLVNFWDFKIMAVEA